HAGASLAEQPPVLLGVGRARVAAGQPYHRQWLGGRSDRVGQLPPGVGELGGGPAQVLAQLVLGGHYSSLSISANRSSSLASSSRAATAASSASSACAPVPQRAAVLCRIATSLARTESSSMPATWSRWARRVSSALGGAGARLRYR